MSDAKFVATPVQTIGPFYHFGLPYDGDNELVPAGREGAIRLTGIVYDGAGAPVPDALVEIWQAAPDGSVPRAQGSIHRDGWTFTGFGRSATDRTGRYSFTTLQPGPVGGTGARWFSMVIFARGLLGRLYTRCYVPGPELDADPLLASVEADRRGTLIATVSESGFEFDIRLQGEGETVFLRYPGQDD